LKNLVGAEKEQIRDGLYEHTLLFPSMEEQGQQFV
jgi:hypothetical protein